MSRCRPSGRLVRGRWNTSRALPGYLLYARLPRAACYCTHPLDLGGDMSVSLAAGRAANPERRFYQWMIVAIIACIALGFSRSFFLRPLFPGAHAPGELWFYVHGVLFTTWLALLFTQVSLIGAGNTVLHRRLGVAAYVI